MPRNGTDPIEKISEKLMDIRNSILEYFEKTEIPSELEPQNVKNFVVPLVSDKRTVEQEQDNTPKAAEKAAEKKPMPPPAVKPADAAVTAPVPHPVQPAAAKAEQAEEAASEKKRIGITASDFIKVVRYHKLTGKEFLSLLGNSKISNDAYQEIEGNPGLTVKRLIEILDDSPLTSSDYERLVIAVQRMAELKAETREKIKSEPARTEIAEAPKAPKNKLVEESSREKAASGLATAAPVSPIRQGITPDVSDLTEEIDIDGDLEDFDYVENKKIKRVPFGKRRKNEEADEDNSEDDEIDEDDIYEDKKSKKMTRAERRKKKKAAADAEEYGTDEDEEAAEEDEEEESGEGKFGRKSRKKKRKSDEDDNNDDFDRGASDKEPEKEKQSEFAGKKLTVDYDDDDDDDNDYDSFGRIRTGSNKGKLVAAAIGAVVLIGLSFGIRYYYTGSLLPSISGETIEKDLTEEDIFDRLNGMPNRQIPAFSSSSAYTVGGVEEKPLLQDKISGSKRMLYTSGTEILIFEQIGGQIKQLAPKTFGEDRQLLGMMQLDNKTAFVTLEEAEPYTFSYTTLTEEETEVSVSSTVTRKETCIEISEAEAPEKAAGTVYKLSGTLAGIFRQEQRLIAVTCENIPDGAAKEDIASFMPYIVDNGVKRYCTADKVFIENKPSNSSFVTVFSIELGGETDMAAAAGSSSQLIEKQDNTLFIGQGSRLIRYDLSQGVKENGSCEISGSFGEFSAVNVYNGIIRATALEDGSACLTVMDEEFTVLSEVKNLGNGEMPVDTCFYKDQTFVVTESGMCYGIDGENNVMSESSVKITDEKLYHYSDEIGIRITSTDDGSKRTGITVSTVKTDGTMTALHTFEISSKTVATDALDEYLTTPAEMDINALGGTAEDGYLTVPVIYFDGISEVERFIILSVTEEGALSYSGSVVEYDRQSKNIFADMDGDTVIAVTKGKIITAKAQNGSVMGYYLVDN